MATLICGAYHSLLPTQLRLIRLSPDLDDPISGYLEETTFAEAPPYYAVSHAWSPDSSVKKIPESGELHLSNPLAACIRGFQKFSTENTELDPRITHIWLDSVCINQEDVHERSQQVALMGNIYSRSIRTLIWLGEMDSPTSHLAWQLIADTYAVFQKQNPTAKALSDIPIRTYDHLSHVASGLPPLHDSQWAYLKQLMELRWFSRMWVVQEVVLSPEDPIFLHGDCHYAWELLGWAVAWLRRSGYLRLPQVPEQLRNVDTISNLRRARTRWPLDALMSITQVKFQATDQRDKIYGVLGLARECEDSSAVPEELKPDYSIDVATLYQRVARFLLKRNRSLAILNRARCLDGTETRKQRLHDLNLPSWCPDWSDFSTYNEGISTSLSWIEYTDVSKPARFGFPKKYRAADGLQVSLHEPESSLENSSILQLGGFRVDQVAHVHRFNIGPTSHAQASDEFDATMAPIVKFALSPTPLKDAITWMKHFIQTTTASQHDLYGKDTNQSFADGAAWLHGFFQRREDVASLLANLGGANKAMLQILEASTEGAQQHYAALVRNYCFDRSFIVTAAGRMGIGPSNTCQGDTVAVILGGGVPYILRASGEYWNLVGESFINGLMAGEAIESYKQGVTREEVLWFQ
ncbi:hypothetical protein IL306_008515 [Fusarium sp. DS 682]|nr:hypothetical protein IL306_008515 [Fusarium sp. DS 682]